MRFEELEVWKRSARLSAEIYKQLKGLKAYDFHDQIIRAGLSIPSTIAEVYERQSPNECINFLLLC
jgi:four helix bundle protein